VEIDPNVLELEEIAAATLLIEGERAAIVAEYEAVGTAFSSELAALKAAEATAAAPAAVCELGAKFSALQMKSCVARDFHLERLEPLDKALVLQAEKKAAVEAKIEAARLAAEAEEE